MEKFNSEKHRQYINHLPFSYFSVQSYLDFEAYVFRRNNELLIVNQDLYYPHDFPNFFIRRDDESEKIVDSKIFSDFLSTISGKRTYFVT